jgi:ATP-dependent Clp protease ATP-binding subunit ClpC
VKQGIALTMTDEARKWLLDKTSDERSYGARPLKRALQKHIEDALSESLIQGHVRDEGEIEIFLGNNELAFRSAVMGEIEEFLSHAKP